MNAERRHQHDRIRRRRIRQHNNRHAVGDPRLEGMVVHTNVRCSCPMCGNPRKWFGERTIQERRAFYVEDWCIP